MNFTVDQSKCTQCKQCVIDCPVLIINGKTEYPSIKEGKEENCLKCQHCLAVCPEGAISIFDKKPEDSIPITSITPKAQELENLMQLRRSTRRFAKEELDKELILNLVKKASYAPTAKNENAVQYTLVDNKAEMDKVREQTYNMIKKHADAASIPAALVYMSNFQGVWESKGIDVIFRNAPHMLIASAPKSNTAPIIDSTIALSYFDLLANANGIGTLWDGFAKNVFEDIAPEIKSMFGIPAEHTIASVIIFGKAGVKYHRSIQNDHANIKHITL